MVIATDAVCVPAIPVAFPVKTPLNVCGVAVGETVTVTVCDPPAGMLNVAGVNVISGLSGEVTFTMPVKPFRPVAVTVSVDVCPAPMVSMDGFTDSEKSGPARIVTPSRALRVPAIPGAVPLKMPVFDPGVALLAAVTVTVCDPPGRRVNVAGENVTPGIEGAVTLMLPLNPFTPVADTFTVVL
jgi:hypothetical protein